MFRTSKTYTMIFNVMIITMVIFIVLVFSLYYKHYNYLTVDKKDFNSLEDAYISLVSTIAKANGVPSSDLWLLNPRIVINNIVNSLNRIVNYDY